MRRVITLLWLCAAPLAAQNPAPAGGRCPVFNLASNPVTSHSTSIETPSKQHDIYIGGGAIATCPSQNQTIIADSAEQFGDTRVLNLIGNVHYTEPRLTLNSERLTYWQNDERVRAEGHVDATLPSGTNMVGPVADYYRAIAPVRTTARLIATGRPTIKIVQLDSVTKKPGDPVIVIANNVSMEGDTLVYAGGKVEITRPDIVSHSDSAVMNSQSEKARLIGQPVIDGRGERPFQLSGLIVDLFAKNKVLQRVLSSGSAKTVSEDVTLTADTIDFRMADRLLQRAFAWGQPGKMRAHAVSPTYDILADSLAIKMPGQRLQEVRSIRDAYAESLPDTIKIRTRERDWLKGDTIIAYFDSGAVKAKTSTAKPGQKDAGARIKQLISLGHAQSFYHIASKDTTTILPSINYVKGNAIQLAFADQQVQRVDITGPSSGVYLEPEAKTDTSKSKKPPGQPAARPPVRSRP
ncbi:MAG: hypothetical protein ABJD07_16280 [Gemmatimonadaceae bacterium]